MREVKGFTLIELLVVLAIVVIGVTVAVPSYSAFVQRQQMTTAVHGMVHLLNLARMEAVRRQRVVTLCPSTDRVNCTTDWRSPIMVFGDGNRNRTRDPDDPLLRVQNPEPTTYWTANQSYIQYQASGMIRGSLGGSLFYCHLSQDAHFARRLVISRGGRVRLSQDNDGDGIHEGSDGVPLDCSGGRS